jgi:hypothetical protein
MEKEREEHMGTSYRLEVQDMETTGGLYGGWRPAIAGHLNHTGRSDVEASTFTTEASAVYALAPVYDTWPESVRIIRSDGVVVYEELATVSLR